MLKAYDFQLRNFQPTRVTPESKTCIDHMILQKDLLTETIETTISDHYSVLASVPKTREEHFFGNLKILKGDGALNFLLFFLDSKITISLDYPADDYIAQMFESKMECVDRIAPEKSFLQNIDNQWITKRIQNALFKRDQL